MKIKTANIRKVGEKPGLKSVTVKKTFTHANELFFIFKDAATKKWNVSHYTTGLRVCSNARTVAQAEEDFIKIMETMSIHLAGAVAQGLKDYGPANKLPEAEK